MRRWPARLGLRALPCRAGRRWWQSLANSMIFGRGRPDGIVSLRQYLERRRRFGQGKARLEKPKLSVSMSVVFVRITEGVSAM